MRALILNKQIVGLLLFLALLFSVSDTFWVTPFKVPIVKASVSSGWYYSNMSYRVEHNTSGSPAGNQINYQTRITILNGTGTSNESVYYTTHVNQSGFDDARFTWYNTTSGQEEEIDYWCEKVYSGSNATFWVEIPEVSNETDNTIYIYYGNSAVATTSNVNATFIRVIDGNQPVVLALRMDEGGGNRTYDQSGNDNNGTLYPRARNDGPQWIDGKFGKALSFDGQNGYVEVSDDNSLNVTGAIAVEAWIKTSSTSHQTILCKCATEGSYYHGGFVFDIKNQKIRFSKADGVIGGGNSGNWDVCSGTKKVTDGDWDHVVSFWDGTTDANGMKVYVNGYEDGNATAGKSTIGSNNDPVSIGSMYGGHDYFNGSIDEVRIYNRTLTAEEISDLYNYYGYVTANYAGRVLVRKRVDPEPSHGAWGSEVRYVPVHDIAVVSVAPSSDEVVEGDSIDVLVEVQNEGTESETFNVTAYYDSNIIGTQANIFLKPRTNKVLTFTWDTTAAFPGNHNISAQASTVPGETDINDNIFTEVTIKVIMGYPMAHFTYSPMSPFVNETVTFNATLSTPNGGILVNYAWDFSDGFYGNGVIVYHNYSKTGTYNVTLTVTDDEMVNNTVSVTITIFMHDISIVSITPSTNEIYEGQTMNIAVVVQNNGNLTETFNVTVYANTTIIQTQEVPNLVPNNQITLTFIWNTAEASLGHYTIKAEASIVPEETYAAQTITVHPPPSWYTPLITWLISVPPLIWVGISIPIILAALFWRGMIKVEIEKLPEPAEELKDQTNMLLQPLTEKDERFIPLHQFLHQLLEKNPPPETIEFLQNTFPVIIHSLQENLIRKRSTRVRAKIVKREDREKHRKRARNQKK